MGPDDIGIRIHVDDLNSEKTIDDLIRSFEELERITDKVNRNMGGSRKFEQQEKRNRQAARERHQESQQQSRREAATQQQNASQRLADTRKIQAAQKNAANIRVADIRRVVAAEGNATKLQLAGIKRVTDSERLQGQNATRTIQRQRLAEQSLAREQRDRHFRIRQQQRQVRDGFDGWTTSLRDFALFLGGSAISDGFRRFGRHIVTITSEFERLRLGLNALTGDRAATDFQLRQIRQLADLPGIGFTQGIRTLTGLTAAGVPFDQGLRLYREIANVASLSGATQEDIGEAIRQFRQVISAGEFTQQDLRPILQRIPLLQQAFLQNFGSIQSGQVNEAIREQGLTIQQAVNNLVTSLEAGPRAPVTTLSNRLEILSDEFDDLTRLLGNELLPAMKKFVDFLTNALKFIQTPVGGGLAATTVGAGVGLASGAAISTVSALSTGLGGAGIGTLGLGTGLFGRVQVPEWMFPGLTPDEIRKRFTSDLQHGQRFFGDYTRRKAMITDALELAYATNLETDPAFLRELREEIGFDTDDEQAVRQRAIQRAQQQQHISRVNRARLAFSTAPMFGAWGSRNVGPLWSGLGIGAGIGLGSFLGTHSVNAVIAGRATDPFRQALSFIGGGGVSGRNNVFQGRTIASIGHELVQHQDTLREAYGKTGPATARFTKSLNALEKELSSVNDISRVSAQTIAEYQQAQKSYRDTIIPTIKTLETRLRENRVDLRRILTETQIDGTKRTKAIDELNRAERERIEDLNEEYNTLNKTSGALRESLTLRAREAAAIRDQAGRPATTAEEARRQMEENRRRFAEGGGFGITPEQARGRGIGPQILTDGTIIPGGIFQRIDLTPQQRGLITPTRPPLDTSQIGGQGFTPAPGNQLRPIPQSSIFTPGQVDTKAIREGLQRVLGITSGGLPTSPGPTPDLSLPSGVTPELLDPNRLEIVVRDVRAILAEWQRVRQETDSFISGLEGLDILEAFSPTRLKLAENTRRELDLMLKDLLTFQERSKQFGEEDIAFRRIGLAVKQLTGEIEKLDKVIERFTIHKDSLRIPGLVSDINRLNRELGLTPKPLPEPEVQVPQRPSDTAIALQRQLQRSGESLYRQFIAPSILDAVGIGSGRSQAQQRAMDQLKESIEESRREVRENERLNAKQQAEELLEINREYEREKREIERTYEQQRMDAWRDWVRQQLTDFPKLIFEQLKLQLAARATNFTLNALGIGGNRIPIQGGGLLDKLGGLFSGGGTGAQAAQQYTSAIGPGLPGSPVATAGIGSTAATAGTALSVALAAHTIGTGAVPQWNPHRQSLYDDFGGDLLAATGVKTFFEGLHFNNPLNDEFANMLGRQRSRDALYNLGRQSAQDLAIEYDKGRAQGAQQGADMSNMMIVDKNHPVNIHIEIDTMGERQVKEIKWKMDELMSTGRLARFR